MFNPRVKRFKPTQPLKKQMGFTLVEILVALAIFSVIGLGTTSLLKTIIEIQRLNSITSVLKNLKTDFYNTLNNDTAWRMTFENASQPAGTRLACLREGNAPGAFCVHNSTGSNFNIFSNNNTLIYSGTNPNQGFTPDGTLCNTFNNGAGNDPCPYRYNLSILYTCPDGVATCPKPQLLIQARFIKNPATKGSVIDRVPISDFDFDLRRTESQILQKFIIQYVTTGATGGGPCSGGLTAQAFRSFNRIISNEGNNLFTAMSVGSPVNLIRIRQGSYECEVTAHVNNLATGYSIKLYAVNIGTYFSVSDGFTQTNSPNVVQARVNFYLPADSNIRLIQYCPNATNAADMTRQGRPLGFGPTENIFTELECTKF